MNNKIHVLKGRVISNKMQKTIVVVVDRLVKHKLYKKIVKRTTKLHAHDVNSEAMIGDLVEIKECRPVSKTKSWVLTSIIKKSNVF